MTLYPAVFLYNLGCAVTILDADVQDAVPVLPPVTFDVGSTVTVRGSPVYPKGALGCISGNTEEISFYKLCDDLVDMSEPAIFDQISKTGAVVASGISLHPSKVMFYVQYFFSEVF